VSTTPEPDDLDPHLPPNALRNGSSVDLGRIEKAVREILEAIGEDPDRDGLLETPSRVARMYAETRLGCARCPSTTCA
jgi:GTP cyclohydrolase IA